MTPQESAVRFAVALTKPSVWTPGTVAARECAEWRRIFMPRPATSPTARYESNAETPNA